MRCDVVEDVGHPRRLWSVIWVTSPMCVLNDGSLYVDLCVALVMSDAQIQFIEGINNEEREWRSLR